MISTRLRFETRAEFKHTFVAKQRKMLSVLQVNHSLITIAVERVAGHVAAAREVVQEVHRAGAAEAVMPLVLLGVRPDARGVVAIVLAHVLAAALAAVTHVPENVQQVAAATARDTVVPATIPTHDSKV